jgi:hypothetical protein
MADQWSAWSPSVNGQGGMANHTSTWSPWAALGLGSTTGKARQQPYSWLPWGTEWGQTPWAGVSEDQAQQQMAWMNVALPWMQAAMQGQQWGTEFDWRKAMDEWQKQFEQQQFGWQKEQDVWGQGFQEQQLAQQKALEQERQAAEKEMTTMQTFGRRWRPQTRWM